MHPNSPTNRIHSLENAEKRLLQRQQFANSSALSPGNDGTLVAPDFVQALREEFGALRATLREFSSGQHDLLTPEQVAERLSLTPTKITRLMNARILPRGLVWFQTPLGRYFSWQRLTEWMTSDPGRQMPAPAEGTDSDDPETWRRPA